MVGKNPPKLKPAEDIAEAIAEKGNCDIIAYNGPTERPFDEYLIQKCIHRNKRENVLLLLITEGGNPDAAYRISRCLQDKYNKFSLYLSGYCKSAGTIVALGAHELIISDHGELGPLDIQLAKKDEIWEAESGLTVMAALEALKDKAFSSFEEFFLQTTGKSGGRITVKTAAEIAARLVNGLYSPISEQIDPMHIGEAARAMKIANNYGIRLLFKTDNYHKDTLDILTTGYPSHSFVIDRQEAKLIFKNVREPNDLEAMLPESMGIAGRRPKPLDLTRAPRPEDVFSFLNKELEPTTPEPQDKPAGGRNGKNETAIAEGAEPKQTSQRPRGGAKTARQARTGGNTKKSAPPSAKRAKGGTKRRKETTRS